MTSSLFGIYNAQRGLSLNQAVIDIINNNIANMNTPGYSKQRAELAQLTTGHISTIPQNAAQDSLGAVITAISRNREVYLDNYYRSENTGFTYYKELNENAGFVEDITNELDNIGINFSLDKFYQGLNQLSANPADFVTRNNVVQNAIELTTKFNSMYTQLKNLRTNLAGDPADPTTLVNSKIKITSDELNSKLNSVANLNHSILLASNQGSSPNYLLDQRDKILDEISKLIPVEITNEINGAVTLKAGNTMLVSGNAQVGFFDVTTGDANNPAILQIKNDTGGTLLADASSVIDSGQIGAILEISGSSADKLTIKGIMDNLDTLAQELATAFNALQVGGQYIDSTVDPHVLTDGAPAGPPNFFVDDQAAGTTAGITAENICIYNEIINDPYKIAAADIAALPAETGDGSNALLMSQIRTTSIANLGGATTEQYIINMTGEIGNKTAAIKDNYELKDNILNQIKLKRESVTGVNLDEEMTDLIRFQRAYEASARVFNIVDKNLQTIINLAR